MERDDVRGEREIDAALVEAQMAVHADAQHADRDRAVLPDERLVLRALGLDVVCAAVEQADLCKRLLEQVEQVVLHEPGAAALVVLVEADPLVQHDEARLRNIDLTRVDHARELTHHTERGVAAREADERIRLAAQLLGDLLSRPLAHRVKTLANDRLHFSVLLSPRSCRSRAGIPDCAWRRRRPARWSRGAYPAR